MESLGEDACERQDESHRNFKLLPQGDRKNTQRNRGSSCSSPDWTSSMATAERSGRVSQEQRNPRLSILTVSLNFWNCEVSCSSNSDCSFGNSNEIYDKGKNIGKLIDDPTLTEIGRKYGKSGAQTALGNISTPFAVSLFRCFDNSLPKQQ